MDPVLEQLDRAWALRAASGVLPRLNSPLDVGRVFNGPGEGEGALSSLAIDLYGSHAWVTSWEHIPDDVVVRVAQFLTTRGLRSGVILNRPEDGVPDEPATLFGDPPTERFAVSEEGAQYYVQLFGTRHPGLFLDHAPLRAWLREHSTGRRVLNLFAYTGSLSIAAALGGADQVTSIDLSRPALQWAKDNWLVNELDPAMADWIVGDVFEWLPRLAKKGRQFDTIVVDPPTFSRGTQGVFSTQKDLARLHEAITSVAASGAWVVSSINSANVSAVAFEREVIAGLRAANRSPAVRERWGLGSDGGAVAFVVRPDRRGSAADYLKTLTLELDT